MNQKEFCETKCWEYKPLPNGDCRYLARAKKAQAMYGIAIVKKGELYCNKDK